jgi:4-hydroxy-L-threonine phosphate dehydrogenase PdxA
MQEHIKKFDIVVGMYHDQVLTPMKAIFGFDAINITLGLPFIRISPDHGPNSKMLGKNLSNPKSLIEALKFFDK